jgi:adaptin ear-binding coat-associated protein 1/2
MASMAAAPVIADGFEESVRTLCMIENAFLFKVPPRGATGYSASALKANPLFSGRLEMMAKGEECVILVKDKATGKPYVTCPVRYKGPPAYEATFDSSRYFVLRIENLKTGKHAYAGLGFNKREEALDFKVALQDFETQLDREKNGMDLLSGPSKDLSIKEGEKIKIKIKTRDSDAPRRERKPKTVSTVSGGLSGPKQSGGRRRRKKGETSATTSMAAAFEAAPAPAKTAAANSTDDDLLSLGSMSFNDSPPPHPAGSESTAASTNNDMWAGF